MPTLYSYKFESNPNEQRTRLLTNCPDASFPTFTLVKARLLYYLVYYDTESTSYRIVLIKILFVHNCLRRL